MLDNEAISTQSLETFYGVKAKNFGRSYKHHLSDFQDWKKEQEGLNYIILPQNMGEDLSLDETSLSNGELYTILTNKAAKGKKGSIVAIIKGTNSVCISEAFSQIPKELRDKVKEITLDMAPNMNLSASSNFPNAKLVIDRFHVQQLASQAVQQLRISYRWEAIEQEVQEHKEAKEKKEKYAPTIHANGDTTKQVLARSRYILFKPSSKWTTTQQERAEILFQLYPRLELAYKLSMELRSIFEQDVTKEVANLKLAHWYRKVEESGFDSFTSIKRTFTMYADKITNFFTSRSTNASAESFNAKIKNFRKDFRGVKDLHFFQYRLITVFG